MIKKKKRSPSVLEMLKERRAKGKVRGRSIRDATRTAKAEQSHMPKGVKQVGVKVIRQKISKAGSHRRTGNKVGRPTTTESKSAERIRKSIIRQAENNDEELPLQYMLRVMRDPHEADERRDEMAKSAAPYVHPKLAAVAFADPNGNSPAYSRIERVLVRPDGNRTLIPNRPIDGTAQTIDGTATDISANVSNGEAETNRHSSASD